MKPFILIVEGELTTAVSLETAVERAGFDARAALNAEAALTLLDHPGARAPDLIVLDLSLPGMDGLDFCRLVRHREAYIPIIMVTARNDEIDRVVGLELGADDYLSKPFSPRELIARIRAVLRRAGEGGGKDARDRRVIGELVIDRAARSVTVKSQPVHLTQKEFDLLATLAWARGRVFGREMLLELVWGYDFAGESRTVDVHVNRLRAKIEQDPEHPQYLLTARGIGYVFAAGVNS